MSGTEPVNDWATDYDIMDEGYVTDPVPVWRELREQCPIAHTERWRDSYLPTKYEDVQAFAKMVPELSSRDVLVMRPPKQLVETEHFKKYGQNSPPISSDPPEQGWTRRILLPHFTAKAIEAHRPYTVELCHRLIDGFIDAGSCDGATDLSLIHI